MMKPIDLRDLAGSIYRLNHDESAFHEPGGRKNPWLFVIPCRKGHIYPHSDTHLALWWESTTRLDKSHPVLELYQDGDDEKVYLFKPEHFEKVARMAGAKKRRKLNPAQRQAAILRLRPYQKS
jgi:hypothetical protein